ncbi:SDR family NAD(P)-dependent oxidoreductase [Parasphingorhabdus flavimaris]|uniref:SDR family oxidoreductase n=1 Tax=Parasphingorhabdus flavimaris TaxID=266812 RepID=A0ABX2N5H7_9SPHN|nr:SDR family oxidoreductase [Parasphingorhabdus flavimaris]NVD28966.1 SDR family oxidoreductase [Parasphingorhabdus flavimaris]|tara:strand:+ start:14532 stop:15272 length:741 start_codon:yes stop_codon:yes gene_type:complete
MIDPSLDYNGQTVCIIGGSSGIGNATAHAFRNQGADVHVTGTRASETDYDAAEGSDLVGLTYHQLDAADDSAIIALRQKFDRLDILVCSQGMVMYKRAEFEPENFARVVQVNLNSLMTCAGEFHDLLKQAKGSLIIISSTAAFHATVGNPGYNASKAGAAGLTRTLGKAWAPDGIRVNGIAPGLIATKMTKVTTDNPQRREATVKSIPVGRIGDPDDMAGLALFLASPLAGYIVGQTIIADGGLLL